MPTRDLIIVLGLALAGWGHVLMHGLLGAATAWDRLDARFPAAWRSSPPLAGACLLAVGALFVLVPVVG